MSYCDITNIANTQATKHVTVILTPSRQPHRRYTICDKAADPDTVSAVLHLAPTNFPCGECGIGVKYAGIECTGHCLLWYHAACVSIPERKLTKMTKSDVTSWTCTKCTTVKTPDNPSIPELEEVKSKLKEHETQESDLEASLTLAAEAGNALLLENDQLKQDKQNIQSHNSILKANLASMEAKLEDLLANEEQYINEIEALQVKLEDTLLQLEKSKLQQVELQNIFEKHDQTQGYLILQYSEKISISEKSLLKPNDEKNHLQEIANETPTPKCYDTSETQTFDGYLTTTLTTPLLLEVTQLRKRQEEMEHTVREPDKLKNNPNPEQHKIKMVPCPVCSKTNKDKQKPKGQSYTSIKKPKHFGKKENLFNVSQQVAKSKPRPLTEDLYHLTTGLTGGISQTPTEKLSTTTLTEESSHPTLTEESSHPTTSQAIGLTGGISQTRQKNCWGVWEKLIETPPEKTSPVTGSYLKLGENETYEQFFVRNINSHQTKHPSLFLDNSHTKKKINQTRHTPGGQARLAMNTISSVISFIQAENKFLVLMGDVNFDRLTENNDYTLFEEDLLTYGIRRLPLPATRITHNSRSSIDCIRYVPTYQRINFNY
ncbi:hypothetical protein J6590_038354 [Homalodisca vitripennis]|nr:hypothetical protein J6590_038354 [Homalodisca vitripennis]